MTFYHGLSPLNWILNSANHRVKNEKISKEASFSGFIQTFLFFACLHVMTLYEVIFPFTD